MAEPDACLQDLLLLELRAAMIVKIKDGIRPDEVTDELAERLCRIRLMCLDAQVPALMGLCCRIRGSSGCMR